MRALLILSIIFWAGAAKSAIAPHDRITSPFVHEFLEDSVINPISSWTDSIPKTQSGGFAFIPRTTKLYDVIFLVIPQDELSVTDTGFSNAKSMAIANKKPLLKISGNILYDVNYRSRIDTPYAENNVYQHTIQTRLDVLYKDQYPLKIYFTSRFSNSAMFRNYTDLNLRFNPSDFKRIAKQRLIESVKRSLTKRTGNIDSLYKLMEEKKKTIASLRQSLEKPDLQQKIVEDREKEFYSNKLQHAPLNAGGLSDIVVDSTRGALKNLLPDTFLKSTGKKADSINAKYNRYNDSLNAKRKVLDSLEQELQKLERQYRTVKTYNQKDLSDLTKQIEGEQNVDKLSDKLQQLNLPDTILPKGYKMFSGIQSLNIGRSVADYSELSVKNISITGLQVEYNTQYYYAVAAGKVDYRFRDYIVPNHTRSNQYVALVRFGKGTKNGNHIFLTYYTGKRQLFNASTALQDSSRIPGYNLAGITVEGVYKINRNITIVAEIAKSTIPYYNLDSIQRKKWMSSIGKLNSRGNEAYSVKLFSFFPKTFTKLVATCHIREQTFNPSAHLQRVRRS